MKEKTESTTENENPTDREVEGKEATDGTTEDSETSVQNVEVDALAEMIKSPIGANESLEPDNKTEPAMKEETKYTADKDESSVRDIKTKGDTKSTAGDYMGAEQKKGKGAKAKTGGPAGNDKRIDVEPEEKMGNLAENDELDEKDIEFRDETKITTGFNKYVVVSKPKTQVTVAMDDGNTLDEHDDETHVKHVKEMCGVKDYGGERGKGLVALRDIKLGERILSENPIF